MQLEGASAPLSRGGRNGRERKRAPSPRRLIPFHTVGNPRCRGRKLRAAPGALSALLCLMGGHTKSSEITTLPGTVCSAARNGGVFWPCRQHRHSPTARQRPGKMGKTLLFREKQILFFFFSEMGMKRQTAQTIRFSHAHECPTSRSPG